MSILGSINLLFKSFVPSFGFLRKVANHLALVIILTDVAKANVVGNDTQNFNPTTSGLDFVTVQSSETLDPGVINFGFFLNYAVNTLPYYDRSQGSKSKFNDTLLGADLNMGIGLLPNFDMGLSLPQVLLQDVSQEGYRGQFKDQGSTEIRLNGKWRLLGDHDKGVALIGTVSMNRIKDNPFAGKNSGPTPSLEIALDKSINRIALGLNLGYKWRTKSDALTNDTPVDPYGSQYLASVAASYLLSSINTKLIFEIFASQPVSHEIENTSRMSSTSEALLGVKHDFNTNLAGHFGMGSEIGSGRSSPDWRIYTGINYTIGPTKNVTKTPQRVIPRPASAPLNAPKPKEKIVIHDVLFEYDSSELVVGQANETLSKLVAYMQQKPSFTKLVIDGHTDAIGSDNYNNNLSQRRAETIKRWLVKTYNIDQSKIVVHGKGKRFPIADNGNFQGRQLNRRVEFIIYRNAH